MSPQRIQLHRTKGWRKPEGAVVVSRPSKWGNPFPVEVGRGLAIAAFRNSALGIWDPYLLRQLDHAEFFRLHEAHEWWLRRIGGHPTEAIRYHLAGRDLACWCPLDSPCHADVLLEIANGVES